ncbi:CND3 (condensin subunit 3) family protein [Abortiporus biennis]
MPARTIPQRTSAETLDNLVASVAKIFDQAQNTAANHQKNYVALYKLQSEASQVTEPAQNGMSIRLVGEKKFEDVVLDMISRVLPVKKGASVADRIMKFFGGYVKFMNEKAAEEINQHGHREEDEDTPAARFVSRMIRFLIKGCIAKDKIIRFRVLQCLAEMVSHLGEIDEPLYISLREALLERARDKEIPVRVQAVIALSKIWASDDPDTNPPTILDVLLDMLSYDPSADVRKAALLNVPRNPLTIADILNRTRDVDPTIRKLVYSIALNPGHDSNPPQENPDGTVGISAAHPRALSIAQREMIVRNGLGDREDGVKGAAEKLLSEWYDVLKETPAIPSVKKEDDHAEEASGSGGAGEKEKDLLIFVKLFDLIGNGLEIEENNDEDGQGGARAGAALKVAEDALSSLFKTRPDLVDICEFGDSYFEILTPPKAFLVRIFQIHCLATNEVAKLENTLPVVTALAFKIQESYNNLISQDDEERQVAFFQDPEEEKDRLEEARLDKEFVIGELLKLAVDLDYSDEIGRRKMFQLVRDMLSQHALPSPFVSKCADVLRKLSSSERDLIRVVVEIVHELRDPDEEEELPSVNGSETGIGETPMTVRPARTLGFGGGRKRGEEGELSEEEKKRRDEIDVRCLDLCIGMLERVNGTFEENSTLEGILGELIIPAVKRKELVLREKGLVSLGLCCLIARRMALNSFQLFLSQVQSAPEILKMRVLQIVFDILMIHQKEFLGPNSPHRERIVEFILHVLANEESPQVQALLCVGIAKLMLSGMITDERVLKSLVLAYMSPQTVHNQELRQCLSYFFPVYSYSSGENQKRMQAMFISIFNQLRTVYQEWDGEEDMISPSQIGLMFVDWTDPLKASTVVKGLPNHKLDESVHIDFASDIVKALFDDDLNKEEKKALCQLFSKFHLPDDVDFDKIRTLKLLVVNLSSKRPPKETPSKTLLQKFDHAISTKYTEQLSNLDEQEFRKLENLKELFEFLDGIIPLDDSEDEDEVKEVRKKGKKRRSESVATDGGTSMGGMSGDDRFTPGAKTQRKGKGKGKAKRRRLSQSDEDDDDDDEGTERGVTPQPAPTRVMPRRSAADKSKAAVSKSFREPIQLGSDDEDDDIGEYDDDLTPPPPTPPSRATSVSSTSSRAKPKNASARSRPSGSAGAKTQPQTQKDGDNDDDGDEDGYDSIMDTTIEEEVDEEDEVNSILGDL